MSAISPASAALIEERIEWLDAEMEATFGAASAELDLYRWARYHLGWLDERLRPLSPAERRKHAGKRLRGVLTLLACEAVGGAGRPAAPAAAAVEWIHNFSLVHDDVEDNDAERRHRPTVWKLWGVPHAVNVGSNMQALVNVAALRLRGAFAPERVLDVLEELTRAILRMTEGQYLDMAAEDAAESSEAAYHRMIEGKTAALLEGALRAGALLGGAGPARTEALGEFGRRFGLAFQCRDDYLGIWGEPSVTGKPVGSDILQGKRSLPIVCALAAAGPENPVGRRLRAALAERDVAAVLEALEALDSAGRVRARVEEHTAAALAALERAELSGAPAEAIREIARYALGRES